MKKSLLLAACILFCSASLFSQSYQHAIGLRGGLANGLTFKTFVGADRALELVVDPFVNGIELSGIYEVQKQNAFGAPSLDWYYGAGLSVGFYNGKRYGRVFDDRDRSSAAGVGALGLVGLEFIIPEIPISISGDLGPAINFSPYGYVYFAAGLSVRYYW
ncbi:MAG: hypothetical protein ACPF8V_03425 [Luteibaculum sp.]